MIRRSFIKTGRTRAFVYAFVIPAILLPLAIQADFLSFFSNTVSHIEKQSPRTAVHSQNAPILQAALNHDPNPSKGGGDITVVGGTALLSEDGPSGTLANIQESQPQNGQISIYVVREGDSVSQIAQMFGVSPNTIIWANNIKRGSLISPGQTLTILPINGVRHTVVKGDTLQSIAKAYGGDVEEIILYNGLEESSALSVDKVVTIPGGELPTPQYTGATQIVYGTGGPNYAGYYLQPILGGQKTQGLHGYNGIDFGAPIGTPILAAAYGEVIVSRNGGWNGGYGTYVVLRHPNGTQTLYAHNSSNIVYVGQSVVQGQVIGYVGSTGRSTGSHVHFEVRGAANPF